MVLGWTLCGGVLPAMDFHGGVVALPTSSDETEACGGSAVVVSPDGTAVTLSEALPADLKGDGPLTVILPGGLQRTAHIIKRGATSTGVLLHIDDYPQGAGAIQLAPNAHPALGAEVWTIGNTTGAIALDGQPAISRGTISGVYVLPTAAPVVHGRMGRVLSSYRGEVFETDAGVNDGNQGGALLDAHYHLLALVSLGQARERRLGTAIPIQIILSDLAMSLKTLPSAASEADALSRIASQAGSCMALVRFERPGGLGNPQGITRPPRTVAETPLYDRDQVQQWWGMYYSQQQVFYTDQPAPAIVVDAKAGLLITAAGNLHGGAKHGLILGGAHALPCEVVAINHPLDLALLKAQGPLPMSSAVFSSDPVRCGEDVVLVSPLRLDDDLSLTMTRGVIAAFGRRLSQSSHSWLQISARANYSSLGGAIIDRSGAILGMSVKLSPEGDWLINSGVAMALDGAEIEHALDKLKNGISTERLPVLGMGVMIGSHQTNGRVVLNGTIPGTGAAAAGLLPKDVLEKVDGIAATSQAAIARALLRHQPGDKIAVEYLRQDKPGHCVVELTEFEAPPQQ